MNYTPPMILSPEHAAILDHTENRAAMGRYCGNSRAMQELVQEGLMIFAGKPSWSPDKFYAITDKGRRALTEYQHEHHTTGGTSPGDDLHHP